jgi:hypothetical protein
MQTLPRPTCRKPEHPADWLILARCGLDDIPMRVLKRTTKANALKQAKATTREAILRTAGEVFNLDTSEVHCLSIVKLSAQGEPVSFETVELGE